MGKADLESVHRLEPIRSAWQATVQDTWIFTILHASLIAKEPLKREALRYRLSGGRALRLVAFLRERGWIEPEAEAPPDVLVITQLGARHLVTAMWAVTRPDPEAAPQRIVDGLPVVESFCRRRWGEPFFTGLSR